MILILWGMVIGSSFNACTTNLKRTSENDVEKEYDLEYFDKIDLEGGYNVHLIQGEVSGIIMTTSEGNQDKFRVWVDNRVLHVTTKLKNIATDEVRLDITVKELSDLNIEGGVFLTTKGFIDVEDLNISVQGGAHLKMQLTGKQIKARAEGGVNMEFEGVAEEFIASTEGAGNIDADNLKSKRVNCHVTGVGNASVYATEELDASVEGLGKISYRGNPTINKQVNGIGLVYKK